MQRPTLRKFTLKHADPKQLVTLNYADNSY